MDVPLGPQGLLHGSTRRSLSPIIYGYHWVLISYYIRLHIGQQRDVAILILPILFGISGIDSLQRNIKVENFEELMLDSNFSISKAVIETLYSTTVSKKKPFLNEKNQERKIWKD